MILEDTLQTTFQVSKPLDNSPFTPVGAPALSVYRNGVLHAPGAPPVAALLAAGRYSLTYALSAANGHADNDWVTILASVFLDGITIVMPVWEGNLVTAACDVTCEVGLTIYPAFTVHQPSTGANQAPDSGAAPAVTIYRNVAATAIVPVLVNPITGIYFVTIPLIGGAGWAAGQAIDVLAGATVDGEPGSDWVFGGTQLVAAPVPPPATGASPRYEVIGHQLRFQ